MLTLTPEALRHLLLWAKNQHKSVIPARTSLKRALIMPTGFLWRTVAIHTSPHRSLMLDEWLREVGVEPTEASL